MDIKERKSLYLSRVSAMSHGADNVDEILKAASEKFDKANALYTNGVRVAQTSVWGKVSKKNN